MKNYCKYFSLLLALFFTISSCTKKTTPAPAESSSYGLTTTFAGSLSGGFVNGKDTLARFINPSGVDVDKAGNVYVSDTYNNAIRKIAPDGTVSTLAGNGTIGAANGTGASATFNHPFGLAVDISGNVYIADTGNNLIRKITPGGVVTTLAGSGEAGAANGTGSAASFNWPINVAVDVPGNVYVVDDDNNLIRKIAPSGEVTTLAGSGAAGSVNGVGNAASFNNPQDLAVDASGNVYVADGGNNLIRKISMTGVVSTFAGTGLSQSLDGTNAYASFNFPDAIAFDSAGNLFVADEGSSLIRKVTPTGTVSTFAGNGSFGFANGIGKAASFNIINGIAIDRSENLYVADLFNNMIRKVIAK